MDQTGNSFGSNPASLKGKLQTLEVLLSPTQQQIKNISNELNNHKKEVQILRSEKDTLESVLTMKTADVKKSLSNELVRIEEEMYLPLYSGKDTLTSRRRRTAVSSSRSPLSRERRPPYSSSCSDCRGGSLNWKCRSAARAVDHHRIPISPIHPSHIPYISHPYMWVQRPAFA